VIEVAISSEERARISSSFLLTQHSIELVFQSKQSIYIMPPMYRVSNERNIITKQINTTAGKGVYKHDNAATKIGSSYPAKQQPV
jgi:hypothetical protein